MIDKTLNRIGVGFGLFLMVLELTYINSKSLLYLVPEYQVVDRVFSVVGSLAFSLVTVVVMRKPGKMAMKVFFPIFDTLLVICGFNLKYAQAIIDGTDNPVRFWLTIFLGLFTGLITYSLGIINYEEQNHATTQKEEEYKQRWWSANKELEQLQKTHKELAAGRDEIAAREKAAAARFHESQAEVQQLRSDLKEKQIKLEQAEEFRQQIEKSCTCRYCKQIFPSEAAKRSHEGRCNEKKQTKP